MVIVTPVISVIWAINPALFPVINSTSSPTVNPATVANVNVVPVAIVAVALITGSVTSSSVLYLIIILSVELTKFLNITKYNQSKSA